MLKNIDYFVQNESYLRKMNKVKILNSLFLLRVISLICMMQKII